MWSPARPIIARARGRHGGPCVRSIFSQFLRDSGSLSGGTGGARYETVSGCALSIMLFGVHGRLSDRPAGLRSERREAGRVHSGRGDPFPERFVVSDEAI